MSALFSGPLFFIIRFDFISEETVFSSPKLFRRTDKFVLIRRWSQTQTANNCGLKKTAFNHLMPELHKKTFADEKKSSNHSRKKDNGGKKE